MYVSAIVVAAGKGARFKSKISKPLVKVGALPVIVYSLRALAGHPGVKEIIVVANPRNREGIRRAIKKYRIAKVNKIVLGGRERKDSVANGLQAVSSLAGLVLVHDSGRPFIDAALLSVLIREGAKWGAAVPGVPVKATIKVARSGVVAETLSRENLWEIQTPQAFHRELLLKAHTGFTGKTATDDASMVERLGKKVRIVKGYYNNIKITTPEDLPLAELIAKKSCALA